MSEELVQFAFSRFSCRVQKSLPSSAASFARRASRAAADFDGAGEGAADEALAAAGTEERHRRRRNDDKGGAASAIDQIEESVDDDNEAEDGDGSTSRTRLTSFEALRMVNARRKEEEGENVPRERLEFGRERERCLFFCEERGPFCFPVIFFIFSIYFVLYEVRQHKSMSKSLSNII